METTTCQICGRPIKSKAGVIAHHGYRRPGNGWQTASCLGARCLPYEQSCERIGGVIDGYILPYITRQESALALWLSKPPAELAVGWSKQKKMVARPADFDPMNPGYVSGSPFDYKHEYFKCVRELEHNIDSAKSEIVFLTNRMRVWIAGRIEVAPNAWYKE